MQKYLLLSTIVLSLYTTTFAQYEPDTTINALWQPYFIHQRPVSQHLNLSENWKLYHADQPIDELTQSPQESALIVEKPTSIQMAYFRAGKYPDPYAHLNSEKYEWMEEKIWYYRKTFSIPKEAQKNFAYLSFDGLDYFSRIWLNGELLGRHEGMWGGPVLEVGEKLKFGEENEMVVEVISANFGQKETFNWREPGNIIKSRSFARGSSHRPFFALGMWRGVRLEFVDQIHLARPFMQTLEVSEQEAKLELQVEILANRHGLEFDLHPWHNRQISNYSRIHEAPTNDTIDGKVELLIRLKDERDNTFEKNIPVYALKGRSWLEEEISIPDPKLWYPNGMGHPHLYKVELELTYEDKIVDKLQFDFGIRRLDWTRSAGPRTSDRWLNWQLSVNHQPIFVKGINWMPADPLYNFSQEQYDWLIGVAKDAGIQMIRVWGGGALEIDEFYDACNRNGILVWQDFPLNNVDYPDWPQEVWEAQVTHNIFRLRNHPSLALWCGGNEFNPYSLENTSTLYIMERNLRIFDPSRPWLPTSPDFGATHLYPDFDPVWYHRKLNIVPFVAETGIHSIPEPASLYEIIDKKELQDLSGMYHETFKDAHPEFLHHFMEYYPSRVPRMLSRASHIDDMSNPNIESISEATQTSAGEFYQVMSEGIQSNYPNTTGLLPWVFKRPWPIVSAIHLLDGFGQPSAPYYFLKRTYENLHVMLEIDRLLWKSGETVELTAKILNLSNGTDLKAGTINVKVMDDTFLELKRFSSSIKIGTNPSVNEMPLGNYAIPTNYRNRYLFLIVELKDQKDEVVSRTIYWPRTIPQMEEEDFYHEYTTAPMSWPNLDNGPWLKPTVAQTNTKLKAKLMEQSIEDGITHIQVHIKNEGKTPAFMVHIDIENAKRLFVMSDNFFWLEPGEERTISGKIKWREDISAKKPLISVKSWNSPKITLELK